MKVTYGAIVQRASGRFGGTVHSNWKGVDVVRRFAKPSNPNTSGQAAVRTVFQNLTRIYGLLPSATKSAWTTWATGKPMIARNKMIAVNVPLLAGQTTLSDFLPTPGDTSAIPPSGFAPVGGVGTITSTITAPTPPSGWSVESAVLCAIANDLDPSNEFGTAANCQVFEGTDVSSPYTPSITGLDPDDYYTWAFIAWTAPDGSERFSAALPGGLVTVT